MNELLRTYLCDQNVIFETDDIFGKDLRLLRVSLGSHVTKFKHRIATEAFRFEEICHLAPGFFWT